MQSTVGDHVWFLQTMVFQLIFVTLNTFCIANFLIAICVFSEKPVLSGKNKLENHSLEND